MSISKFLIGGLHDASLHPPALPSDADEIPWVLLERKAYVADRRNDTTAYSDTICGGRIQVTFVAARPPRVSYLRVSCPCPAGKETIPMEPEVLATDDNLLRRLLHLLPRRRWGPQAHAAPRQLQLQFRSYQVGLLSFPAADHGSSLYILRPHRAPEERVYMVAALCDEQYQLGRGRFALCVYSSKLQTWTAPSVAVEDQQQGCFLHVNTKVIAIGGEDGTMGFVDLWRGILLCDVLRVQDSPTLRYIPLPPPLEPGAPLIGDARLSRDIAVVQGRIKCVQQQLHWKYCPATDRMNTLRMPLRQPHGADCLLVPWRIVGKMGTGLSPPR